MSSATQAKCPVDGCKELLEHHDLLGIPSPADPLHIEITRNVYECPQHGLFAYLGDRRFRQIPD